MRTPKGYHVRRGDFEGPGDDSMDRWYIDADGEIIDHRGRGFATKREAIETLRERLADRQYWYAGR